MFNAMKKQFYPSGKTSPLRLAALLCGGLLSFTTAQATPLGKLIAARPSVQPAALAEEITVTGTIRDQNGPLPGASVVVKNTTRGTTADAHGKFRLQANRNDVLIFSMIGYQSRERIADGSEIEVTMEVSAEKLSEVVVVGYGAATRSNVTGAITSVKPSEFNAGVNNSPDQLLQGKVAGLNISRSGDPNANPAIILRGPSTLRTGAAQEPFYVIDGVPGASIQVVAPSDIVPIPATERALNPNLAQNPGY